jgi:hypothetical protein
MACRLSACRVTKEPGASQVTQPQMKTEDIFQVRSNLHWWQASTASGS